MEAIIVCYIEFNVEIVDRTAGSFSFWCQRTFSL